MWSAKQPSYLLSPRTIRNVFSHQVENALTRSALPGLRSFRSHRIEPNSRQLKAMRNEISAISKLLNRSCASNYTFTRSLGTTLSLYEKQEDKKQNETSDTSEGKDSKPVSDKKPLKKSKPDWKSYQDKRKSDEDGGPSPIFRALVKYTLVVLSFVVVTRLLTSSSMQPSFSYKTFEQLLKAGEVKELVIEPQSDRVLVYLHPGAVLNGTPIRSRFFVLNVSSIDQFERRLREDEEKLGVAESVPVRYSRLSTIWAKIFVLGLLSLFIYAVAKSTKVNFKMDDVFSKMSHGRVTIIRPKSGGKGIFFKDVAGLHEAKQEVMEFVDYLKNPAKYKALGAKVPKGALLLGPPGTGKTLLAKAVATESSVPFLTMNGSEFIEMIGGVGASRVRHLFKKAKSHAPCIIYIDEIDAVGRKRSEGDMGSSGESEQTLNQLLVEMDGMASKEGVLMLASTNRADVLDKALLRPGRFDRHITVDLPTLLDRKEIFEVHLSSLQLDKPADTYSQRLSILTPGFSGADIANVCNEAALHAARLCKSVVEGSDLEYAIERVIGGTEKRSHAMSLEERKTVAYHESGHALVGWLLEHSDVLQKVTIVPRTNLTLGFAQYTPHDRKLFTTEQLTDKICMALGGRAAENITFNRITTGAQNDLDKVTKIATAMVSKYGMNERVGPFYVPDEPENNYYGIKPFSQALAKLVDVETRELIATTYTKAEQLLRDNRDKLEALAEALLKKETLNYDQVVELIGPPKYDSAKRVIDPADFENSLKNLSTPEDDSNDIKPDNSDNKSKENSNDPAKMFE